MLITTDDGSHSIYSEQYGVSYHSKYGAITESAHVFIAMGLRLKAAVQRRIDVLEAGVGTGLNAFMTWLEADRRALQVGYTALEAFPITAAEAAALNYPALLDAPDQTEDFQRLHTCSWKERHVLSENFTFEKRLLPIQEFEVAEPAYDIVYFDAFAPQAQPELWTEAVFARLYGALRPDGVLVTYCAQGEFKRRLKRVGFSVERLQGPPGKREMTRGWK
jgi:tRNA U34 5-methylaminomethyl-2-thiouridine-forming methyltransferase MnmC